MFFLSFDSLKPESGSKSYLISAVYESNKPSIDQSAPWPCWYPDAFILLCHTEKFLEDSPGTE